LTPSPISKALRARRDEARAERLRLTVRVTALWFCAQGLLLLLVEAGFALNLGLRFSMGQEPYIREAGLSLLCLGFFILRALREPSRQYLAVDVLILYLLGHVYCLLNYRLNYQPLTPLEWLDGCLDLGLGISLTVHRTRSSQMQNAGSLLADNAWDLARASFRWMFKKGPAPKATLGDLGAPPGGASPPSGASNAKGGSSALPHLD
jgi:hypothetical protein